MIFLKKHMEIWYFLQTFWKYDLSKRCPAGTSSFLYYLERWYFFPKTWSSFPGQKAKDGPSHEILGNMMHRPAKKKQETWYIGHRFGLSLNLFGWRYSTMTNLQYLVPLSPQGQCFGSNHQGCSVKKGVRRNFAKFTGKHLCQGPFLMKLQYPVTLLKKRL